MEEKTFLPLSTCFCAIRRSLLDFFIRVEYMEAGSYDTKKQKSPQVSLSPPSPHGSAIGALSFQSLISSSSSAEYKG